MMFREQDSPPDSKGVLITTSARKFATFEAFLTRVLSDTLHAHEHHDFLYSDVPVDWGEEAFERLDTSAHSIRKCWNSLKAVLRIRVMPLPIHDCHQKWLNLQIKEWFLNGDLTTNEFKSLDATAGTTLTSRSGPYKNSRIDPDLFIRPESASFPTIVSGSGWSESVPSLHEDMNLLLVGGEPEINIMLIIKWERSNAGVCGMVQLWKRQRGQPIPIMAQEEQIFPAPLNRNAQTFAVKRRDVFGKALEARRNGDDILLIDVNLLRAKAANALQRMNLTPAV